MTLLQGDVLEQLATMPAESVNCCVTSPPYWGLRDYGVAGQIGLEPTPEEYVAKMVDVFREVRRVLRKDGTCWLNLGDTYAGYWGDKYAHLPFGKDRTPNNSTPPNKPSLQFTTSTIKPKDLCGIPWRVALALQADGWWLRQDIIWHKPNPMPESVTDRCTKAHEYIFLLTKSAKYWWDKEAICEVAICGDPRKPYAPGQVDSRGDGHDRGGGKIRESVKRGGFNGKTEAMEGRNAFRAIENFRNRRSVWTITTKPYPDAHFATFPEELPGLCILAGCPPGGTVLDPFAGSGTTGKVALELGRQAVLIELNPKYCEMIRSRTNVTPGFAM